MSWIAIPGFGLIGAAAVLAAVVVGTRSPDVKRFASWGVQACAALAFVAWVLGAEGPWLLRVVMLTMGALAVALWKAPERYRPYVFFALCLTNVGGGLAIFVAEHGWSAVGAEWPRWLLQIAGWTLFYWAVTPLQQALAKAMSTRSTPATGGGIRGAA